MATCSVGFGLKVAIGGSVDRNPGPNPGCLVGLDPGWGNPGRLGDGAWNPGSMADIWLIYN